MKTTVQEITALPQEIKSKEFSRRDFLKGGAAVAAVAVVAACTPRVTGQTSPIPADAPVFEALQFFNRSQAAIVHAAAGRIIPGTSSDPGAEEAGVVVFIDEALDGYDRALQTSYYIGLEAMEAYARAKYNKGFIELTDQEMDEILGNMDRNTDEAKQYFANPTGFFGTLRNHVRQGMFADPIYGGNRGAVGWKLLGHPGIVFGRGTDEQKCDVEIERLYMGSREYYATHAT